MLAMEGSGGGIDDSAETYASARIAGPLDSARIHAVPSEYAGAGGRVSVALGSASISGPAAVPVAPSVATAPRLATVFQGPAAVVRQQPRVVSIRPVTVQQTIVPELGTSRTPTLPAPIGGRSQAAAAASAALVVAAAQDLRREALRESIWRADEQDLFRRVAIVEELVRHASTDWALSGTPPPLHQNDHHTFANVYQGPFVRRGQALQQGFFIEPTQATLQAEMDAEERRRVAKYRSENPMTMFLAGDHGAIGRSLGI